MNSKGISEQASVRQSDIPSRKRRACCELQCRSPSELFARKIRSKRKLNVSPLHYDRKRACSVPEYHHFQMLYKRPRTRRETVHREDALPLTVVLTSAHHCLHFQGSQPVLLLVMHLTIPGWLSFLKVGYTGKSKSYQELTLPSSRGIEWHQLELGAFQKWFYNL